MENITDAAAAQTNSQTSSIRNDEESKPGIGEPGSPSSFPHSTTSSLIVAEKDALIKKLQAKIVELEQKLRSALLVNAPPDAGCASASLVTEITTGPPLLKSGIQNNKLATCVNDHDSDNKGEKHDDPSGGLGLRVRGNILTHHNSHNTKISPENLNTNTSLQAPAQRRRRTSILTVSAARARQRRAKRGSIAIIGEERHHLLVEDGPDGHIILPAFLQRVMEERAHLPTPDDSSDSPSCKLKLIALSDNAVSALVNHIQRMNKEVIDSQAATAAVLQAYFPNYVKVNGESDGPRESLGGTALNIVTVKIDGKDTPVVPLTSVFSLVHRFSNVIGVLQKGAKVGLIARCLTSLFFTYLDLTSDLNLGFVLISVGQLVEGGVTIGIVVFSLLMQSLFTFFTKLGKGRYLDTLLSMLCIKPVVDVFRVATGAEQETGSTFTPLTELVITRSLEVGFESLPQGIFQVYLLLQNPFSATIVVQMVTLCSSCLAVGFCMANAEYDLDMDTMLRRIETLVYGRYPESKRPRAFMFACSTLMCAFMFASRCFAMASLAQASRGIFVTWFLVEIIMFLVIKFRLGTYKYFQIDDNVVATVMNVMLMLVCSMAPGTIFSAPYFLGPRLYRWVTGGSIISSWLMYAVASALTNTASASLTTSRDLSMSSGAVVLVLLQVLAGLCFVGEWKTMNPLFHEMIMKTKYTAAMHFQYYIWITNMYDELGPSMDDHRARALEMFIVEYWWREGVMEWLEEKWERWLSQVEDGSAPLWFDRQWRSKIPLDMLPEQCRSNEAAFRETVTVTTAS